MATIRELRANFTATADGIKTVARSVRRELQGIGDTTERSVRRTNRSFNDLDDSLDNLDRHLQSVGDSNRFNGLNRALRQVRTELSSTGRISAESMGELQRSVGSARDDIVSLGDEGNDGLIRLGTAINQVGAQLNNLDFGNLTDEIEDMNDELIITGNRFNDVDREVRNTDDGMDRLRDTVMDVTVVMKALKMSLVGLVPAAAPVMASLTTAAGGVVSSFVAAGAGVAGFATVAIPNLTKIFEAYEEINEAQKKYDEASTTKEKAKALEELQNAYSGLSEEQRKAVESLQDFTAYFDGLRKEFEKPVLDLFTKGLQTVKTLLELLKPVIDASMESVNSLMSSFDQALQTKDVESFFGFLSMRAGPALTAWGETFGNVLLGVMNLMVAFDEQSVKMQNGLLGMTQRFVEWTSSLKDSDKFKAFIDYSNKNSPLLLKLMSDLWDILINISLFLAPLGEVFLQLLTHVTDFLVVVTKALAVISNWEGFIPIISGLAAAFLTYQGVLKAVAISQIAFNVIQKTSILLYNAHRVSMIAYALYGGGVTGVIQGMAAAMRVLNATMLANPIGLVVALLIGLGVAFYTAYKTSETFRNAVNNAWASIKDSTKVAVEYIRSFTANMWDKGKESTAEFSAFIGETFLFIKGKASEFGTAITEGFQTSVNNIGGFITSSGEKVASFFGEGLGTKAKEIASGFIDQLKVGFSSFSGILSLLAPMIVGIGLSLMGVTGPIGIVISMIVSFIGMLYRLSKTNEDVRSALESVWTGIQSIFSSVVKALQPIIDVFIQSFSQIATELGPEFEKTGKIIAESFTQLQPAFKELGVAFGELFTTIKSMVPEFAKIFQEIFPIVVDLFGVLGGAIIEIAKIVIPMWAQTFQQIFPVVLQVVQTVLPIVIQLIGMLVPVIIELAKMVIPMILQAVQLVFPIVLQIIKTVLPVIISLFQTVIPIIIEIAKVLIPLILQAVQMVFPIVLQIIKMVIPIIITLFQTLIPIIVEIVKVLIPLILTVVMAVFPIVLAIIKSIIPIVVGLLEMAAKIITTVLIPAIQFILKVVQIVFPIIISVISTAINIITNIIKLFTSILKGDWSGVWDAVKNILKAAVDLIWGLIKDTFIGKIISTIGEFITKAVNNFNSFKDRVKEVFTNIKDWISDTWDKVVEGAKALPGRIGDGIKSMAQKAVDGAISMVNSLLRGLGKGVNGVIGGVNWVLGKIGVDTKIPTWEVPQYAKGTGGHPGGPMIVGDGRKSEIVMYPDGTTYLSPNKSTLVPNAPKGTVVVSGNDTEKLLGIPKYENGIGDFFSALVEGPKKLISKVWDSFVPNIEGIGGSFGDIAKGSVTFIKDKAFGYLKEKLEGFLPFGGGDVSSIFGSGFTMTSKFGPRWGRPHNGYDFGAKTGTPIPSQAGGEVTYSGFNNQGFGNLVMVKDASGLVHYYAHNSKNAVKAGDKVSKGQIVGYVGSTGDSTGPHVHYEVRKNGKAIDYGANGGFNGMLGNVSGNVKSWIAQAIALTGVPKSWASALETIAMKESGGDPKAYNGWDSNAKAGRASRGLMQTIPGTFNAHKLPGMDDIMNPVHNSVAAIRYILQRYGTVFATPGISSMLKGGPYKGYFEGARVAAKQLAWIAEKGAEYVIPTDGGQRAYQLWQQAGIENGFSATGGSDSQNWNAVINLLRDIERGISHGMNATVIMDSRAVGKLVEPHVTEQQNFNESRWR